MSQKRNWKLTAKEQAIFNNLWSQVVSIFNYTNHQQGYRGIERYRNGLSVCVILKVNQDIT